MKSKRDKVLEFINNQEEPLFIREIANELQMTYASVWNWIRLFKAEGLIETKKRGNTVFVYKK